MASVQRSEKFGIQHVAQAMTGGTELLDHHFMYCRIKSFALKPTNAFLDQRQNKLVISLCRWRHHIDNFID